MGTTLLSKLYRNLLFLVEFRFFDRFLSRKQHRNGYSCAQRNEDKHRFCPVIDGVNERLDVIVGILNACKGNEPKHHFVGKQAWNHWYY